MVVHAPDDLQVTGVAVASPGAEGKKIDAERGTSDTPACGGGWTLRMATQAACRDMWIQVVATSQPGHIAVRIKTRGQVQRQMIGKGARGLAPLHFLLCRRRCVEFDYIRCKVVRDSDHWKEFG
jgi:hypothetical protein